jgi:hypothetical protein
LQGGITTAINADLSEYEIIRFHILRNTAANRGVEFRVSFLTDNSPNGVLISSRTVDSPNGFEGVFDIELATLTGDANFADIDFITIGVVNQFVDQDWTIGPIELVDTDPPLCPGDCDGSGTIDFNDLVAMLFLFGEDLPECDTDGSGVVNFNDLVTALFAFGPCE